MQDDNERFHFPGWRLENTGTNRNEGNQQSVSQSSQESNNNKLTSPTLTSMDDLGPEEETPQLLRTRSDASFMNIQRRSKLRSLGDLQRVRRHRFSINGHFYNHKTSVFTPAYGSVTNVRVNSRMTTQEVLSLLLNKFRVSNTGLMFHISHWVFRFPQLPSFMVFLQVENSTDEFALYVVHESGERTKFKDTEYPLVSRLLHGPCEKIANIFIMERDLGEEVTYDVAQYIKFEMPVLDSFVKKLKEEEEREISKLTGKYSALKSMILQQLEEHAETDSV
ncbi:ras association domain-containing protein 4a isoform X3 [Salminus brasiliensis]